ncbi:MAG: formate C-acetyltransferase/glycerol dehydratase family glycyl radical enzyme, partial [Spirochaetales bacterium]|nr:formate C-acetyltransferase/glycerol dehydratase family glycyl radical enzyme [Spirochaetales bacterium]
NHSSRIYAAPIFPEYAVEWIQKEINDFEKRPGDAYYPDDTIKKELLKISRYWNKKTTLDKGKALMAGHLQEIHDAQIIRAEGNLTSGDAHIAIHFEKLLKRGIQEYLDETNHRMSAITDLSREDNLTKLRFYEATEISLLAFQNYIIRFAELAAKQADIETDPARIRELEIIEANCRQVAFYRPQNFYQGLQLVYFSQVVLQIESNGHSLSLGRMDQLYPLFRKDKEKGLLNDDFIIELLSNVWLKLVSIKKIRSWSHTRFSAGGPLYQNVTIGGQLHDGRDAVNELSFLILQSVSAAKLTQPNLSVRFHPEIDQNFLMKCIDVIRLGFGMPSFNNDSIVIPSLKKLGVEDVDAWDYSAIGCIEVAVPGRWGYRCTGKHFLNFMRVFLAAINDGVDPVSGKQFCKGTGKLEDFTEFSQVMEAWEKQVRYYAGAGIAIDSAIDIVLRDEAPDLLCSAFTDDCLARGMTIHEGGSKYDFVSGLQVGIANLADSLSAIKKLVFEEKRVEASELQKAIQSNFDGPEGERLRQIIINSVPRYGNDDDYVDELIKEAYGYYIDEIKHYSTIREGRGPIGCRYFAGTSSISGNVPAGAVVPATPDGRNAGKPLAEGASPSGGADKS